MHTQAAPPPDGSKLLAWPDLQAARESWRQKGKVVVWTNGCFDLLHAGHVRSLQAAKHFGDILVVGLNNDQSVRHLKGPARPIMPESERAIVLSALACIDAIILFGEATPEASLARLRPDIHCKGAEYAPPHGKLIPEAAIVESYGGRVCFLPMLPGVSTTDLVQRVLERYS
jgi:D-beta-D-heptose 7-phosphate kinase/D-beta-D-heptose 1-phosphate adenosyltransferase